MSNEKIHYLIKEETLQDIAEAVRNKTQETNEIVVSELANKINSLNISDTSDATATAGDILNGKTAYVDGEKITGTIATKTSSNLTASGATVIVPAGYYSAQASKAVSTATQATPTVTINTNTGLITATATQTAGYVAAGTKSGTKQLAFQAAQTITPGTTDKTIAANTYLGGVQTIKGDTNLVASNIVSGKSIFGVVGTATAGGGSGGDTSQEDSLVTRSLTTYTNDRVKNIGSFAFYSCSRLTSVSFPVCTSIGGSAFYSCSRLTSVSFPICMSIGSSAFYNCQSLTSVSFPEATTIGGSAFYNCTRLTSVSFPECRSIGSNAFYSCQSLTSVSFPECRSIGSYAFFSCSRLTSVSFPVATTIGGSAFRNCSRLTSVSFPVCTSIGSSAFYYCQSLASIYLAASTVCSLIGSGAFSYTAIWSDKGSIFVPASLLASYKSATNWAFFSARIFSYNFT